jgi:tellurite resistance protein
MKPSDDERYNLELLKLLAQVAWGDDQLDPSEADAIYSLGRSWFVSETSLDSLRRQLKAGRLLPPPNIGALRADPETALEAVRALVLVDGRLSPAETDMVAQIKMLLATPA